MPTEHCIVLCTVPDRDTATAIARRLVADRLAACVNILPGATSVYRWQGSVEEEEELLLLIKTGKAAYPRLERTIQEIHPYELPEIVAVSLHDALPAYRAWMDESLSEP